MGSISCIDMVFIPATPSVPIKASTRPLQYKDDMSDKNRTNRRQNLWTLEGTKRVQHTSVKCIYHMSRDIYDPLTLG